MCNRRCPIRSILEHWLLRCRFVVNSANLSNCICKGHMDSSQVSRQGLLMSRRIEAVHVLSNLLHKFFDETIILQREAHDLLKAIFTLTKSR